MADRVDASVDDVKASGLDAAFDLPSRQSSRHELQQRDRSMLPLGKLGDDDVGALDPSEPIHDVNPILATYLVVPIGFACHTSRLTAKSAHVSRGTCRFRDET